jgi:hypothetical protein
MGKQEKTIEKELTKALKLDLSKVTKTQSIFNANQAQKIFNSTPKRWQYQRPGKGGEEWTYVRVSYVRKQLDGVFGFNWDIDIETTVKEAFDVAKLTGFCVVKGILIGRTKLDGEWIPLKKVQFGRAEVKWKMEGQKGNRTRKIDPYTNTPIPLDFGNDMKAAASDALKKCASLFGIAADIYETDDFFEIVLTDSDDESERTKAAEKKVKEAAKQLKEEATEVK